MTALIREWAEQVNASWRFPIPAILRESLPCFCRATVFRDCRSLCSADEGASKFSGRLFDVVAKRESVDLRRVLHIGDDLYTDALSASQRGLAVRRVRRPAKTECLPEAPACPADCADPAFASGYMHVGPHPGGFCPASPSSGAMRWNTAPGICARDGELLLRVAQTILHPRENASGLALKYLHLSRRALACVA